MKISEIKAMLTTFAPAQIECMRCKMLAKNYVMSHINGNIKYKCITCCYAVDEAYAMEMLKEEAEKNV